MHTLDGIQSSSYSATLGIEKTIPVRFVVKGERQLDRKMLAFLICQQEGELVVKIL